MAYNKVRMSLVLMLVFMMMVATTTTILHVNGGNVKDHEENYGHGGHSHGRYGHGEHGHGGYGPPHA